ncbi:AraC family transcriptional regulator [Psychroflexus sp. CAK57W]|uniref:helix-turn-helix domain-containing protein n=1 Tax=Psychroflexus curvus TaxID=2873595 RepID=UPI001CCEC9D3|nr:AraC family transcriptional regulator [Psychroflexus curvus]MBZ9786405.1 AraC family transcriptional regulator [Psychroflexus curvus]
MELLVNDIDRLVEKKQVKVELKNLKKPFEYINNKIAEPSKNLNQKSHNDLKNRLSPLGLKVHSSNKIKLVDQVKATIKEMLKNADKYQVLNCSSYISMKLSHDYTYLANIFSEVNGISIQQYIIHCKIERVKFYFLTSDISLTEISYLLHYSSVAHLSSQFKKTTGHCPSSYKQILNQKINMLGIG